MSEKLDLRKMLGAERYLKLERLCRQCGGTDKDPRDVIMTTMEISPEDVMESFEEVFAELIAEKKQLRDALEAIMVRCAEGCKKTNWLPIINNIAKEALKGDDKCST